MPITALDIEKLTLKVLLSYIERSRKHGFISLENELSLVGDDFLHTCLLLVIDCTGNRRALADYLAEKTTGARGSVLRHRQMVGAAFEAMYGNEDLAEIEARLSQFLDFQRRDS